MLARPIATKSPMHIVLHSHRARGAYNMLSAGNCGSIEARLTTDAKRFHVKVLVFSNVGKHLHLLVKAQDRAGTGG